MRLVGKASLPNVYMALSEVVEASRRNPQLAAGGVDGGGGEPSELPAMSSDVPRTDLARSVQPEI